MISDLANMSMKTDPQDEYGKKFELGHFRETLENVDEAKQHGYHVHKSGPANGVRAGSYLGHL